ncbi:Site-specific recombinase XerD [Mycobacterium basiliense]|uniref:Site-specific recombinase XerD n=1 Tax=Mycobacterium basiliense TaxID=2094119 RepID=A0A447GGJ3_9MYCO|nr:hypothetical protein [Mycobacterium basiliense]VDM89617.1 Site-specific recombinase XerD [Mycobacterium basiliense]
MPTTIQGYEKIYRAHIAAVLGSRPVAAITTAEVARFRADLLAPHPCRSFVTRGKPNPQRQAAIRSGGKSAMDQRSPATVKHIVGTLKRILDTAVDDQAIPSNPVVAGRRRTTKPGSRAGQPFRHRPLTSSQVAALAAYISNVKGNPIYALVTVFAAYTGVRAAELQGLQVQDVMLSDMPGAAGAVRISRTAARRRVEPGSADPVGVRYTEIRRVYQPGSACSAVVGRRSARVLD